MSFLGLLGPFLGSLALVGPLGPVCPLSPLAHLGPLGLFSELEIRGSF
jgi:hypothetical protein